MRGLLHFLTELVLTITGALAVGAFVVGGSAFLLGCTACGCTWWWRRRRARRSERR
ncbi:hypothetical protein [Croceibacterium aestuarii]|uniref:hypothetical protein n=1 Tax=Croceibacterium aestuarii TaxID=3064139 RepID=UPI00272E1ADF|nr:hypothetical protein [Croceibacterium sp. D39]